MLERFPFFLSLLLAVEARTFAASETTSGPWKEVSRRDDVTVYQKAEDGTPTISLRGEGLVKAPWSEVIALLRDSSKAQLWIPYVAEKRVLRALTESEQISYTHVGMPWPLTDRYTITHEKIQTRPDGSLHIEMKSVEYPEFQLPKIVLAQLHYSHFQLIPQNKGEDTLVVIEVNTDPKGMIPKWLVNITQQSWPRDFIQGLRRQLRQLRRDSP